MISTTDPLFQQLQQYSDSQLLCVALSLAKCDFCLLKWLALLLCSETAQS